MLSKEEEKEFIRQREAAGAVAKESRIFDQGYSEK